MSKNAATKKTARKKAASSTSGDVAAVKKLGEAREQLIGEL